MNNNKSLYLFQLLVFLCISGFINAQDLSDATLKIHVKDIEDPLQKLIRLQPRQFRYNSKYYTQLKLGEGEQYGFMADNMQTVFPNLVKEKKRAYLFGKNAYRNATVKTINETGLIPVLVASVKQQQETIEQLRAEIAELKKEMAGK